MNSETYNKCLEDPLVLLFVAGVNIIYRCKYYLNFIFFSFRMVRCWMDGVSCPGFQSFITIPLSFAFSCVSFVCTQLGEGFKSFADVAHLSLSSTPDEEDEDVELEGFEGQLQWVEGMHFWSVLGIWNVLHVWLIFARIVILLLFCGPWVLIFRFTKVFV